MLFLSIIILIICKALINDKLPNGFYHRISAIILLFSGLLDCIIYNLDSVSGIGIYSGLFNINIYSQILGYLYDSTSVNSYNLYSYYSSIFEIIFLALYSFVFFIKTIYINISSSVRIDTTSLIGIVTVFFVLSFIYKTFRSRVMINFLNSSPNKQFRKILRILFYSIIHKKGIFLKTVAIFELIFVLFASYILLSDLFSIFYNLFVLLFGDTTKDLISFMTESTSRTTEVKIIHSDSGWADVIKKIFIYGVGGHRYIELVRAGAKAGSKSFVVASTIGGDVTTNVIQNVVNDPTYIKSHWENLSAIFKESDSVKIDVNKDQTLQEMVRKIIKDGSSSSSSSSSTGTGTGTGNNLLPNDFNLEEIYNKTFGTLLEYFASFLQPVQVDYSNELLANQINDLSIVLFILSVLIIFLFISLTINILILINSDRILNFFTNKYIRAYINFNKKIIGIEVFFLSANILYFMYNLSYGIHFIATHPISFK